MKQNSDPSTSTENDAKLEEQSGEIPVPQQKRKLSGVQRLLSLLWGAVLFFSLLLVIRTWILAPYRIPTSSMEPTLFGDNLAENISGDTVLVWKVAYLLANPERWDLVAFHSISQNEHGVHTSVVKRIVGLPGETVDILDGELLINDGVVPKPATIGEISYICHGKYIMEPITLGEGEYFVLGDNPGVSRDSRQWGPLPGHKIFGKVVAVMSPWSRARWMQPQED